MSGLPRTTTEICDGLATKLRATSLFSIVEQVQTPVSFTEALPPGDCPIAQVYWQSASGVTGGNTSRTTFSGAVRYTTHIFHIDLYARARSHLAEDWAAVQDAADTLMHLLLTEQHEFFGVANVQEFSWRADRTVFQYTQPTPAYAGLRFVLEVKVF